MFSYVCTLSQQFGGHPVSMKWKQINTDTLRVIFPAGLEKEATEIANISHLLAKRTANSIGTTNRKINIVLQNYTTVSNGYVGLGPGRSEFQLTPLQNSFQLGSLPWHQTLALHEYRHVQQYNNFRKGISKGFYYLFGEQGLAVANSTAIPDWFWEGDAVVQETIMSTQGRGRLPYFFNGYHSLWSTGKKYSWMKLRNGSLRDYIPDHYQLGYMMVVYGRKSYGEEFWKKVTDDAVRFKGIFYPFQRAVKKYSGEKYKSFRQNAFDYFRKRSGLTGIVVDSTSLFAAGNKHFQANEEFPQWIDSSNIIFVHSSYNNIPTFKVRNIITGKDRKIGYRGISLDNYFSYKNQRIVYATYEPDIRWGWRDYSVLNVFDIPSGSNKRIAGKTKYFAPDIDASGQHIIAVNASQVTWNELHFIRVSDGTITKVPVKEKLYFTYPKFYESTHIISAARDSAGKMMLVKINLNSGEIEKLTEPTPAVIGFIQVYGDSILFTASSQTGDEIFILAEKKITRIELRGNNQSTGSYHAARMHDKVCWTDFTAVGYRINHAKISETVFHTTNTTDFGSLFSDDEHISDKYDLLNSLPDRKFPVLPYSQSFRLFRFHSWRPAITDPEYSFAFISENILNTLQSEFFLRYNRNEQSKQIGFTATYAALFPWIRMGTNYTFGRQARFSAQPVYWNEWEGSAGLVIPLNLTRRKSYRNLSIGADVFYNKRYYTGNFKDSFDNRGFAYLNSFFNFTNQIQKARKQIYPRFAQSVAVRYTNALTRLDGNQFMASADWYFPGVAVTHNLVLNTAFHRRDTMRNYRFSNTFPFSRGYIAENFHQMIKFGVDYHFPVVYPDRGFGSIIYFLRIRSSMFYDRTEVLDYLTNGDPFRNQYRSYGTEIYFDTKWWNQQEVSFGIRYSRLIDAANQRFNDSRWEFILPVTLQ